MIWSSCFWVEEAGIVQSISCMPHCQKPFSFMGRSWILQDILVKVNMNFGCTLLHDVYKIITGRNWFNKTDVLIKGELTAWKEGSHVVETFRAGVFFLPLFMFILWEFLCIYLLLLTLTTNYKFYNKELYFRRCLQILLRWSLYTHFQSRYVEVNLS